jgi:hypothetical protein
VSRFGCGQSRGNGLGIAHLAHDNHVRVLAQHVDERPIERMHVRQHLLLHHNGAFVFVNEFNRVFNRDDLAAALIVD